MVHNKFHIIRREREPILAANVKCILRPFNCGSDSHPDPSSHLCKYNKQYQELQLSRHVNTSKKDIENQLIISARDIFFKEIEQHNKTLSQHTSGVDNSKKNASVWKNMPPVITKNIEDFDDSLKLCETVSQEKIDKSLRDDIEYTNHCHLKTFERMSHKKSVQSLLKAGSEASIHLNPNDQSSLVQLADMFPNKICDPLDPDSSSFDMHHDPSDL